MRLRLGLVDSLHMRFLELAQTMIRKWKSKDGASRRDGIRDSCPGLPVCGLSSSQGSLGAIEAQPAAVHSTTAPGQHAISANRQSWQDCGYPWLIRSAFSS